MCEECGYGLLFLEGLPEPRALCQWKRQQEPATTCQTPRVPAAVRKLAICNYQLLEGVAAKRGPHHTAFVSQAGHTDVRESQQPTGPSPLWLCNSSYHPLMLSGEANTDHCTTSVLAEGEAAVTIPVQCPSYVCRNGRSRARQPQHPCSMSGVVMQLLWLGQAKHWGALP